MIRNTALVALVALVSLAAGCRVRVDCESCRCACPDGRWIDVCHPDACGVEACRSLCATAFEELTDEGMSLPDRVGTDVPAPEDPGPDATGKDQGRDSPDEIVPDAEPDGAATEGIPDPGPDGKVDPGFAEEVAPDAPDAPGDAGPDCGGTVCVDCECSCPDGSTMPYGGCYNACDPLPEPVRTCTLDCTTLCGGGPQYCSPFGGSEGCPEGFRCITPPCPHCGAQPQAVCLPPPCTAKGCWLDTDCSTGERCEGGEPMVAVQGRCLAIPGTGECWTDADCPAEAQCAGAGRCETCVPCKMAERPGTCVARPGVDAVVLWVDGTLFTPGEVVIPVWFNLRGMPAWLPGCQTFAVEQRSPQGQWKDLGPAHVCKDEGIARRLDPGAAWEDFPATSSIDPGSWGTFRLRGTWAEGCEDGKPLSQAGCSATHDVYSGEFTVGAVP